jgi:hypothetical protein
MIHNFYSLDTNTFKSHNIYVGDLKFNLNKKGGIEIW